MIHIKLELYFVNPEQILVAFTGTRLLTPQTLTVLSYYFWFNRCYRCQPMAHQLESFRLAGATGLSSRALVRLIMAATIVGILPLESLRVNALPLVLS